MQEFEESHQLAIKQMETLRVQQESCSFSVESLQRDQTKIKKHVHKAEKDIQVSGYICLSMRRWMHHSKHIHHVFIPPKSSDFQIS